MSIATILIIILVLLLVGAIPRWGYNNTWGNGPMGILGIILVVVVILMLTNRI